jgi:hypothetical protein
MTPTLIERLHALAKIWTPHEPAGGPLNADPWVISSLLQKSIRRGDADLAERAALTLYRQRGTALFGRLMLIAFEDVGIGSVDALALTVASGDASFRKSWGSNDAIARVIVRALADAPKDRSADYLLCGADRHPSLAADRRAMADWSIHQAISLLAYQAAPLQLRAISAVILANDRTGQGGAAHLLGVYKDLGVPHELVDATRIGAAKTREAIALMLPLLWLAVRQERPNAVDCSTPEPVVVGNIPMYALDKHTRLGREAIGRFARQNAKVRACVDRHVESRRQREVALMAAFYTDAMPISRRLDWSKSRELEDFGREADLFFAGVPLDGIWPVLQVFAQDLPDLNRIRAEVFVRNQSLASSRPASVGEGTP